MAPLLALSSKQTFRAVIICVSILGGFSAERLGGNCPVTFYHFVGIGATKVLTHFVSMLETISGLS